MAQSLCKLLVALGEHSADYLALHLAQPQVQTFFTLMLGFSSLQGYYGVDEDVSEVRPPPPLYLLYPLAFLSASDLPSVLLANADRR